MVDYSGIAVDTFGMTKGLYDAYAKGMNDRLSREKTNQEMKQKAYDFDNRKKTADLYESGQISPGTAVAGLLRSNFPVQAMQAQNMPLNNWRNLRMQPGAGQQSMMPQPQPTGLMPLPPPRPQESQMPQSYRAQQGNPVQAQFPLKLVRIFNQDKANQRNSMQD